MEGIIRVTPDKLTSAANSFNQTGSQVRTLTGQMTTLVEGLTGSVWSGDAATAYTTKFKGLQDDIERMCKMIDEHVNDLNAMANEYTKAEAANVQAAANLSADVII